jgi:hypothetical protein
VWSSQDERLDESSLVHLALVPHVRAVPLDGVELRLGLRVALQFLSFADADTIAIGLGVAPTAALLLRLQPLFWIELGASLFAQPAGGHAATAIHFGPTAMLTAGFRLRWTGVGLSSGR